MCVYTRPDRTADPFIHSHMAAPGLIFQKWQSWDSVKVDRTESRSDFLRQVASSVQTVYVRTYENWHDRYATALRGLGVTTASYALLWRLIIGLGTNPTLETGINLHPLLGFPYIPGSAVKGLLHHVAEMEVMDDATDDFLTLDPANAPSQTLLEKLKILEQIRFLFGSIQLEKPNSNDGTAPNGPIPPREILKQLKARLDDLEEPPSREWKSVSDRLAVLLNDPTGGILRFYDAVPVPAQSNLLQVDIVNCHYIDYYRDQDNPFPPSDDQNPIPVTFLAVRPGVNFEFAWRLDELSSGRQRGDDGAEIPEPSISLSPDKTTHMVTGWLKRGLGLWGIGAKTASGYGYFDTGVIESLLISR